VPGWQFRYLASSRTVSTSAEAGGTAPLLCPFGLTLAGRGTIADRPVLFQYNGNEIAG
jgi:hypothetical protein